VKGIRTVAAVAVAAVVVAAAVAAAAEERTSPCSLGLSLTLSVRSYIPDLIEVVFAAEFVVVAADAVYLSRCCLQHHSMWSSGTWCLLFCH